MPSQSPALPSYSKLDGQAPATHRRSPSKLAWQTRTQAAIRRPVVLVSAFAACLVVYILVQRPGAESALPASSQSRTGDGWHDSLDRLTASWRTTPRPPTEHEQKEACNPFEANGRLTVDLDDPRDTVWTPYDRECEPSNLMTALYRPPGDTAPLIPPAALSGSKHNRAFLPWFRNRTIVLHGDSIDRYHLKDFCSFVGGKLTNIDPHHPASPPMWIEPKGDSKRREMEQKWRDRPKEGWELTNPWVCDIEEYGTTLVSIFTWGLAGAEEFFEMERWYHPPARWTERMDEITVPLLQGLANHLDRPQITQPDLVVLNSGYWDLRKYTEEDFVAAGFPSRPYPEDSPIPYTNLSPEREKQWERDAREAIRHAARTFRGKEGKARNGPALLWRTLHHPPRHNYAPFPRVFALDSLARHIVSDLRSSSPSSLGSNVEEADEDLGLAHRLRLDESGRIMLGQEHHFRDLLHPKAVPGSWIWADVMLYELKRAVDGVDR
ncbi:uncharacterized protein JCM10292_000651 [Rhodotorula paludigena]|uniref:uncharacterized protein n=1 Tax=Rhodotorula paludigena TaxID=86838 RepID=UPI00317E3FF5